MSIKRRLLCSTMAALPLLGLAGMAQAQVTGGNLLGNSGFEAPYLGVSNYQYNPGAPGWQFNGEGILNAQGTSAWYGNTSPSGFDGAQYAFLQGNGSFSQTFNVPDTGGAGTFYHIGWLEGSRPAYAGADGQQTYQVLVDGHLFASSGGSLQSGESFRQVNQNSGALSLAPGPVTLTFQGQATTDQTAFIDDVSVTPTGYRMAKAQLYAPGTINAHVGGSVATSVGLANIAPADGYSGSLALTGVSASGAGFSATNNIGGARLAAGSGNGNAIGVTLNNVAAGYQAGTVNASLYTDANGVDRTLAQSGNIGSQSATVGVNGFRYAQGSLTSSADLGNVHVGGTASGALSLANTAYGDGYSEGLDVTGVSASGAGVSAGNRTGMIAAGQTNAGAIAVSMANVAAGRQTGSVTVGVQSDGAGTSGLGTTYLGTMNANVSATGYRYAQGQLGSADLGNVHVGGTASGALSLANTVYGDGYSEGLDVTGVSASGSGVSASNRTGMIAAGQTNAGAIAVSMSNVAAGRQTGNVGVVTQSDGAYTSGLGTTALAGQNASVSATGYRLAASNLANATINFGAARVGDAAPTRAVTIQNTQIADGFSEGLDVKAGAAPAGYNGTLDVSNLAAGGSAARALSLATTTAGSFSGPLTLALDSNGAGTSGLGVTALAPVQLALNGKVYQTAQASVTPNVDFGIVHRGDTVAAQAIAVANTATGALVDQLTGGFGAVGGPFTGSGTLKGVASGNTDSTSLKLGLNTAATGGFKQTAALALASHDGDLSDVGVKAGPVTLAAQVNDYAKPVLQWTSGAGTLSGAGTSYTLDLGDLAGGSSGVADLSLLNALSFADSSAAYTDLLSGSFQILSGAGEFSLAGFGSLQSLAASDAGSTLDRQLQIAFDTANLAAGGISEVIEFDPVSINAAGSTALAPVLLHITGTDVPEPASFALMLSGLIGLISVRRFRRAA